MSRDPSPEAVEPRPQPFTVEEAAAMRAKENKRREDVRDLRDPIHAEWSRVEATAHALATAQQKLDECNAEYNDVNEQNGDLREQLATAQQKLDELSKNSLHRALGPPDDTKPPTIHCGANPNAVRMVGGGWAYISDKVQPTCLACQKLDEQAAELAHAREQLHDHDPLDCEECNSPENVHLRASMLNRAEAEVSSLRTGVEALTRELELLRAEYDGYREVIKDEHPDLALKTADLKAIFGSQPAQRKAEWERDALSAKCAELTAALKIRHFACRMHSGILGQKCLCHLCDAERRLLDASSPDSALARVEAKVLREAAEESDRCAPPFKEDATGANAVARVMANSIARNLRALATEREKRTTTEGA